MKRSLLILLLLLFVYGAFSQSYIGDVKSVVRSGLKRYMKSQELTNSNIIESGDTMTLHINDPRKMPAEFRYIFNENRWCIAEQKLACRRCADEFMKTTLAAKKYEWVKINDSTYVSKYSKKRLLQVIAVDTMKRVDITKIKWSKEEYAQWLAAR
jgi:hypothetical protein